MTNRTTIPRPEWLKQGEALFGSRNPKHWRFRCPSCGHIQTWEAFARLGIEDIERVLGFTCVGFFRWRQKVPGAAVVAVGERDRGAGCRFGGNLHNPELIPLFVQAGVTVRGGKELPVGDLCFNFAT